MVLFRGKKGRKKHEKVKKEREVEIPADFAETINNPTKSKRSSIGSIDAITKRKQQNAAVVRVDSSFILYVASKRKIESEKEKREKERKRYV